jgi:hypothetical protein
MNSFFEGKKSFVLSTWKLTLSYSMSVVTDFLKVCFFKNANAQFFHCNKKIICRMQRLSQQWASDNLMPRLSHKTRHHKHAGPANT